MKKKYALCAAIVAILCIVVVLVVVRGIKSTASKDNNANIDKAKATWSAEEYVNGKDKESNVSKTTKVVDTDPKSITVLVNKEYNIDKNYKPKDLVVPDIKFSFNYEDEKRYLRKEAADNLELLFQGAKYFGYELLGVSGFRSYNRQKTLYECNLLNYGFDYTQIYSAMPGTSEHQTGLAIDISCKSMNGLLRASFGNTDEGKWVQSNAYKYGFIVRYPNGKNDVTGYGYEPWHIRYVGYDLAKFLHDKNMTLDEYYEYKLNKDLIDRETYAYYDDLLTRNSRGNSNVSQAVLDDLVRSEDREFSTKKPSDNKDKATENPSKTKNPSDIMDELMTEEPIASVEPTESVSPTESLTPIRPSAIPPTERPETPTSSPPDGGESNDGADNNGE